MEARSISLCSNYRTSRSLLSGCLICSLGQAGEVLNLLKAAKAALLRAITPAIPRSKTPILAISAQSFHWCWAPKSPVVIQVYQNIDTGKFVTIWRAWGKDWSLEFEMSPVVKFTFLSGPALEFTSNCVGEITFSDGDHYTTTIVRPPPLPRGYPIQYWRLHCTVTP